MQDEASAHAPSAQGTRRGERFRTTVYLTETEVTVLDELRAHFRRREKRKVDQSQLIREAIRHYRQAMLAR